MLFAQTRIVFKRQFAPVLPFHQGHNRKRAQVHDDVGGKIEHDPHFTFVVSGRKSRKHVARVGHT